MLNRHAFLCLAAKRVEIPNVGRDTPFMGILAVDETKPNSAVSILQGDKVGGFTVPVIVEDQVKLVLDVLKGPILNRIPVSGFVHQLTVEWNTGPVPRLK